VDRAARQARAGGRALELTRKEFDLLAALVAAAGRILPAAELRWEVWGYNDEVRTRTLDVHIGRLRQKLAEAGAAGCRIVTKPGVGYGMEGGEVES
jgi:DNA-binding response OmpR family regulator